MSVSCLTCKAAVSDQTASMSTSEVCSCPKFTRLYDGGSHVAACVGNCGRTERFPDFLEVGSYLCCECLAFILIALTERSTSHEPQGHQVHHAPAGD